MTQLSGAAWFNRWIMQPHQIIPSRPYTKKNGEKPVVSWTLLLYAKHTLHVAPHIVLIEHYMLHLSLL